MDVLSRSSSGRLRSRPTSWFSTASHREYLCAQEHIIMKVVERLPPATFHQYHPPSLVQSPCSGIMEWTSERVADSGMPSWRFALSKCGVAARRWQDSPHCQVNAVGAKQTHTRGSGQVHEGPCSFKPRRRRHQAPVQWFNPAMLGEDVRSGTSACATC